MHNIKRFALSVFIILILCGCGNRDLSEYGNSGLMEMSGKHPSNVTTVTRSVSVPQTYDRLETDVALPEQQPEYAPHILTDQEKKTISTELYNALQAYYDSIYYKDNYDADAYFNAFDNDTVRQKEYEIAYNTATNHGITVEELLSFYPYQFKSNEVASLDKDRIRNEKEQEGYAFLEESYKKVIEEYLKRLDMDDFNMTIYRKDNQFFVNIIFTDLAYLPLADYVLDDKTVSNDINITLNLVKGLSSTLKNKLDNDYGLKNGIVSVTVYDTNFPNEPLYVFTNGEKVYDITENIKDEEYEDLIYQWEYLGE